MLGVQLQRISPILVTAKDDVMDLNPADQQLTYDLDRQFVFHSWSAQGALKPMVFAGGQGSWMWDYEGNKYLDFTSQLVFTNIGHQHPKVVAAIAEQAAKLSTVAPQHAVLPRGEAAKRIVELASDNMVKVFFTNGGADANENAIRMARQHTGRAKVLSHYRSYHGNTGAAIQATGDPRRWPNEFAMHQVHFFGPHLYRSPFWSTDEAMETQRALEHLEQVIVYEGAGTIAAILLESVVGTAGVLIPPPGYLAGVRELCDKYGIMWIADEVMAGFGRTGTWFGYQLGGDLAPDLITFAKGSNSGYVPVGGVVISDKIARTFDDRVFPGGLTYSGHPLGTASIVATIDVMQDEQIVPNAARLGTDIIGPELRAMAERHPVIGEVRGTGVFWALDLVTDRATKEMIAPYGGTSDAMNTLVAACKKEHLLPFTNGNRLHIVPPCNISDEDLRTGLAIVDRALTAVDAFYTG